MQSILLTPHKKIFAHVLLTWVRQFPREELILELGSGLGDWVGILSSYGYRIIGLDIDQEACKIASIRNHNSNSGFVTYTGSEFPFKDDSFTGIYAHEVIEHVQKDELFISEAYRVLKDNGSLVITTPNGRREPLSLKKHAAHVKHYLPNELILLLTNHGFLIENIFWRIHPLCMILDDIITKVGAKVLTTNSLQPGLTEWSNVNQSIISKLLLVLYKFIEPIIDFLVSQEFNFLKEKQEARNMIVISRKNAD